VQYVSDLSQRFFVIPAEVEFGDKFKSFSGFL
jgi:hypothetical protein